MSLSAGFKTPLCRELCRTRKIKRVDEACRLRAGLSGWFKWVLRTYTLSPHLVSTLCRIRFVSTLCPYALSKAKEQANVPAPRSLPMRLEPAVSAVYWRAHEVENDTAGDGGLQRSGFSVHSRCALESAVSAVLRKLPPALDPRQPPSRLVNVTGTKSCAGSWSFAPVFHSNGTYEVLPESSDFCGQHIRAIRDSDGYGGE